MSSIDLDDSSVSPQLPVASLPVDQQEPPRPGHVEDDSFRTTAVDVSVLGKTTPLQGVSHDRDDEDGASSNSSGIYPSSGAGRTTSHKEQHRTAATHNIDSVSPVIYTTSDPDKATSFSAQSDSDGADMWDVTLPLRSILRTPGTSPGRSQRPNPAGYDAPLPLSIFESSTIAHTIAEYLPSVDLILHFPCLHDLCRKACDDTLRSRISNCRSGVHDQLLDDGRRAAAVRIISVDLRDRVTVTYAPSIATTFLELKDESAKQSSSGLIFGILCGPLARDIITLPHRRRSDKDVYCTDGVTRSISDARSRSEDCEDDVAVSALPRRMQHEHSHISTLTGWWLPLPPQHMSVVSPPILSPLATRSHSPASSVNGDASHRAANRRLLVSRRLPSDDRVTLLALKQKLFALRCSRPFFPLIFDVTAACLRSSVRLRISHIARTAADVSHLLRLPTEPSERLMRRACGDALVCRLEYLSSLGLGGGSRTLYACEYELSSLPRATAPDADNDDELLAPSGSITTSVVETRGLTAIAYAHLRKPARPSPSSHLATTVHRATASSALSVVPPRMPTCRLTVFLDGMQLPLGFLPPVPLNMPLVELRQLIRTSLQWAQQVVDHCDVCVFRNRVTMLGGGAGAAPSLTPRPLGQSTPKDTAISRRSSARSNRLGSGAVLLSMTEPEEYSGMASGGGIVMDALPPTRGQFLHKSLEGTEETVCGWLTRDVSIFGDCALVVVVRPKPIGPMPQSNVSMLSSTTLEPSQLAAGSLRVRHVRAQRAKDAVKDVHPALQAYFAAHGAAVDAARRGDLVLFQQLVDPTPTSITATVSPTAGAKALSSKLPADLPPTSPLDPLSALVVHAAADNGRKRMLEFLIAKGFPVDRRDSDGQYPLHRAAFKGHAELIPVLLRAANGATALNAPDHRGRTPLHCALEARFVNTALWLVEQGANPDLRDPAGKSAADMACLQLRDLSTLCRSGDTDAVAAMLRSTQPLTDALAAAGDSAAASWYTEALKHRLTRGRCLFGLRTQLSVHSRTGNAVVNICKVNALHDAILAGHLHVVRLLLSHEFRHLWDLNEVTADGDSALHLAARCSVAGDMFPLLLDIIEEEYSLQRERMAEGAADAVSVSPIAYLLQCNARGETPLHSSLRRRPLHAAAVLVHVLSRCQAVPERYPLAEFGYLALRAVDKSGMTVCHLAVLRGRQLPDGVVAALVAAALSAPSTPPTSARVVASASAGKQRAPKRTLAERFQARFPHKTTPARPASIATAGCSTTLFHVAVASGSVDVMTHIVDLLLHCVRQDITWPLSEFGSLASPGLLAAAYVRDDLRMFQLLRSLHDRYHLDGRLRPFVALDLTTTLYRCSDEGDIECAEVPIAWRILTEPHSQTWVDEVVGTPLLVASLRRSDHVAYEYNSVNRTEPGVSTLSLLVDEIAHAHEEQQRRRLPLKPPPPPVQLTTWGQFLVKEKHAHRTNDEDALYLHLSSAQRLLHHRLAHREKQSLLLYGLSKLLTALHPKNLHHPTATERAMFARRVLYAAIRCRGHDAAFSVILPHVEGTHVFSHEDLVRATHLGVQYGLTPSNGVCFDVLRPDGRMFTPGTPGLKASRQQRQDGGTPVPPASRGSLFSRGSMRPRAHQGGSGSDDDADLVPTVVTVGDVVFHEHSYETKMRQRESQLCQLIPYVASLSPGGFLHDLCARRMFGAAMTLLVTATANAHQAVAASSSRGSPSKFGANAGRNASPVVKGPIALRHDNVQLRCEALERASGVTALHMAAQFGVSQLVQGLLRSGQFQAREPSFARHWTAMHWAARYGHIDTCRTLLSIGVPPTDVSDPTASGSVLGTTPLHLAAVSGDTDLVRLFLDHHAVVDARSLMGRTPLHLAARKGRIEASLLLLDAGAKVDREDDDGYTPLLLAAQEGHGTLVLRVVSYLKRDSLLLSVNRHTGVSLAHFTAWMGSSSMQQLLQRVLQHSAAVVKAGAAESARPGSAASVDGPPASPRVLRAAQPPSQRQLGVVVGRDTAEESAYKHLRDTASASWTDQNASFGHAAPSKTSLPASCGSALDAILAVTRVRAPYLEQRLPRGHDQQQADALPSSSVAELAVQQAAGALSADLSYGLSTVMSTRRGASAVMSVMGSCASVELTVPQRDCPPSDSRIVARPPAGGSLNVLQALVDATQHRREAMLDHELHRYVHIGANAAATVAPLLQLPTSFTKVSQGTVMEAHSIVLQPDRRGDHEWLPLHYALANGQKDNARLLREFCSSRSIQIHEVVLDKEECERSSSLTRDARERRRSEAQLCISFPVVPVPTISAHIAAAKSEMMSVIFPLLPPAPPPPKLWHVGYYGSKANGVVGAVTHAVQSTKNAAASRRALQFPSTFSELSRQRVLTTAAWLVSRRLIDELLKYLPLLDNIDDAVDATGITLLMVAAYYNHCDVARVLLDFGANVNARAKLRADATIDDSSVSLTPILVASIVGCMDMVDTLIEHGADVDAVDECGNTAVHNAVMRKNFKMLKALLHARAQIHVRNHAGDTPEDIAVALRTHHIIRMLRWWSMTFSIEPADLKPHRDPCQTEMDYADWISATQSFYKRLDMLHHNEHLLLNKDERDSVPALMYIRLCQRQKVVPSKYVIGSLVSYWWPEDVKELRLSGVFLEDASLVALFTFLKLLTHLEDFEMTDCKLTDAAMEPLCTACFEHPHLRRLHLSANRGIGRAGAFRLLQLCTQNTNIVAVDLSCTGVDVPHVIMVNKQVESNMKQQSASTKDPTKVILPPVRHKPYHLPRISTAAAPSESVAAAFARTL